MCTDSLKYAWSLQGPVKIVVIWGTRVAIPGGHCFSMSMSVPMVQTRLKHSSFSYLGFAWRQDRQSVSGHTEGQTILPEGGSMSNGTLVLSLETRAGKGLVKHWLVSF